MATVINGNTGIDKVQDGSIVASDLNGNQTGDAPIYGCRAWVNFDGTRNVTDTGPSTNGQPVKIRASGNVTSVVKNAVGDYTVNFTTAMPDANYSVVSMCALVNRGWTQQRAFANLVSSVNVRTVQEGSGEIDSVSVNIAIFR